MQFIVTCKNEKDRLKNNREKVGHHFPHYKSMEAFCWRQSFLSNLPQNIMQPLPTPNDATHKHVIKTGQLASEIFKFKV